MFPFKHFGWFVGFFYPGSERKLKLTLFNWTGWVLDSRSWHSVPLYPEREGSFYGFPSLINKKVRSTLKLEMYNQLASAHDVIHFLLLLHVIGTIVFICLETRTWMIMRCRQSQSSLCIMRRENDLKLSNPIFVLCKLFFYIYCTYKLRVKQLSIGTYKNSLSTIHN